MYDVDIHGQQLIGCTRFVKRQTLFYTKKLFASLIFVDVFYLTNLVLACHLLVKAFSLSLVILVGIVFLSRNCFAHKLKWNLQICRTNDDDDKRNSNSKQRLVIRWEKIKIDFNLNFKILVSQWHSFSFLLIILY